MSCTGNLELAAGGVHGQSCQDQTIPNNSYSAAVMAMYGGPVVISNCREDTQRGQEIQKEASPEYIRGRSSSPPYWLDRRPSTTEPGWTKENPIVVEDYEAVDDNDDDVVEVLSPPPGLPPRRSSTITWAPPPSDSRTNGAPRKAARSPPPTASQSMRGATPPPSSMPPPPATPPPTRRPAVQPETRPALGQQRIRRTGPNAYTPLQSSPLSKVAYRAPSLEPAAAIALGGPAQWCAANREADVESESEYESED